MADYLRDGIYELRVQFRNTNYRMLCFLRAEGSLLFVTD